MAVRGRRGRHSSLWLILGASLAGPAPALGATIPVTIPADAVANDGACSLREAVGAANTDTASGASPGECGAGAGADVVLLGPGTFALIRSGAADADVNATGRPRRDG